MDRERDFELQSEEDRPGRRSGLRTAAAIALIIIFLIVGTGIGAALYAAKAMKPTTPSDKPVRVTVAPGMSPMRLADELEHAGLVRSGRIFGYYLHWKKEGAKFKAGEYEWKPGVTYDELIAALNKGDTVKEEVNRFTVPEGYTVKQIADRLAELHIADASQVLALANRTNDWTSAWASAIPATTGLRYVLEGYLFPETYEMKKDATAQDIVQRMLSELDKKLAQLPAGWQETLQARGQSFHQMLTVASLIEREAALDEERPLVASVIYNRLKQGMPLQIDATIQYLFDQPKERLVEKDLQLESPYNTYLHEGLPPGPIASPSLSSIRAAIEPADTNFLFYVTKKDGSKGHLFADNFEQHKKNVEQSKKNGG